MARNNKTVTIRLGLVTCTARLEGRKSPLYVVSIDDADGDEIGTLRLTASEWGAWVKLGTAVRS
jgi:hypothetical protein